MASVRSKSKFKKMNFAQIEEGSVMREKREEKREKKGKKREKREKTLAKGRKVRCDDFFSPSSSSSSDLQVESRERSQGKPKTSKFLMVGKLDFYVFHT